MGRESRLPRPRHYCSKDAFLLGVESLSHLPANHDPQADSHFFVGENIHLLYPCPCDLDSRSPRSERDRCLRDRRASLASEAPRTLTQVESAFDRTRALDSPPRPRFLGTGGVGSLARPQGRRNRRQRVISALCQQSTHCGSAHGPSLDAARPRMTGRTGGSRKLPRRRIDATQRDGARRGRAPAGSHRGVAAPPPSD